MKIRRPDAQRHTNWVSWVFPVLVSCALWSAVALFPCALGQSAQGSEPNLEKLFELLATGEHYKVRLHAVKVLGMLRRDEALPHLVKALREDPDQLVRATAAWALGMLNNPGAIRDLVAATSKEVPIVSKRARRALEYVLASFPNNLRGKENVLLHFHLDRLTDKVNKDKELTIWVQQYFLERLLKHANIEVGVAMDIEVDGETPDKVQQKLPSIGLAIVGGVKAVDVPRNRAKGMIRVTLEWEVFLDPPGRKVLGPRTHKGVAEFAGGEAPADGWTDDPLIEAEKEALEQAVDSAFAEMANFLKLVPK